jgi:hypothetical protein
LGIYLRKNILFILNMFSVLTFLSTRTLRALCPLKHFIATDNTIEISNHHENIFGLGLDPFSNLLHIFTMLILAIYTFDLIVESASLSQCSKAKVGRLIQRSKHPRNSSFQIQCREEAE